MAPPLPELTVGQVAGIIAAVLVVIQLFCPAAATYLLAALLKDTETASTWTVASASLTSSVWPRLLRTDSSGNGGRVRTMIKIATKSLPFFAFLCAVTGIVTPLGLGQELTELKPQPGTFEYAKDTSPYGLGTSERGQHELARSCSGFFNNFSVPTACPYSDSVVVVTSNSSGFRVDFPDNYNFSIPAVLREIYSSGTTQPTTVSNFFDIEWRQLSTTLEPNLSNKSHDVGLYRQLDSFILSNTYRLVEGLVIDAKVGGIGFRNHSIPVGFTNGAEWEEDILFIEPSTACVNTNLTFDFEITTDSFDEVGGIKNLLLRDQGGFVNLNTTLPEYDHDNAQSNPDLLARAYKAAWTNNALTMLYMNVTNQKDSAAGIKSFSYMNSQIGQGFKIPSQSVDSYKGLSLSPAFGNYLHLSDSSTAGSRGVNYSNPFNITTEIFRGIPILCSGTGNTDLANMSNIYVGCGLLRGAPQRIDGGSPYLFEDGGRWSSPLHACAATIRATIRTVRFAINGTTLSDLSVQSITPKTYSSENDLPLWGMEDTGLSLDGIDAIWGLISPSYTSRPNISTIRQPHFHIPGYSTGTLPRTLESGFITSDNIPGATFAQVAMNTVLGGQLTTDDWPFDYRGTASMAIFERWRELSPDADSAASIVNLMWTDLAASAVVGTKGVHDNKQETQVMVRPRGTRVTYDVRFGIPALFLLLAVGIIVVVVLAVTCFGKGGLATLRRRIGQLSVGRVFTTFLYPEESTLTMRAGQWREANGLKTITVGVVARPGDGHGGGLGEDEQYIYTRNEVRGDVYSLETKR
ncbi:hypothetical protein QBC47DRAFT_415924 [Echria macrotheca]|uniref:Uncharacterized protein n=1 Tax=Echria macrotheca TaxID=438768 RepID=A0AAJ0B7P5_9PEZI|nr:hypothetical protein QBC47DRAFT_415924 [Echria macrotheca]